MHRTRPTALPGLGRAWRSRGDWSARKRRWTAVVAETRAVGAVGFPAGLLEHKGLRRNPDGDAPVVHQTAFVDPTAIQCGRVIVEENVFIGPGAVTRADAVDQ